MEYTSFSDQLNQISDQLEEIESGQKVCTEDVSVFSLMPENMEAGNSVTWRNLISGLRKYHNYSPGQPTDIPVKDGQPYGLGLDIDVGTEFEGDDFEVMVECLWDDVKGYSLDDTMEKIREWEDTESISDLWETTKELPKLGAMLAYEKFLGNGLSKSYAVDENSFGVRFYETEDSNYVNLSAGVTNHGLVLEKAEEAAEYIDGKQA